MLIVGNYIKQNREALNLSSRKLSEAVGISSTEMMKIEKGKRKNPSWQTLCKVANELNVHPFDILCLAGYIKKEDVTPAMRITGIDELSEDSLKLVQHFINFTLAQQNSQGDKNHE